MHAQRSFNLSFIPHSGHLWLERDGGEGATENAYGDALCYIMQGEHTQSVYFRILKLTNIDKQNIAENCA